MHSAERQTSLVAASYLLGQGHSKRINFAMWCNCNVVSGYSFSSHRFGVSHSDSLMLQPDHYNLKRICYDLPHFRSVCTCKTRGAHKI